MVVEEQIGGQCDDWCKYLLYDDGGYEQIGFQCLFFGFDLWVWMFDVFGGGVEVVQQCIDGQVDDVQYCDFFECVEGVEIDQNDVDDIGVIVFGIGMVQELVVD